ncbi:MAG: hypothetical protein IKQ10_04005 [Oscillospiraceae bacterium]|nr:hypothetical protein [Oscillospiraceae bacterium]
MKSFAVSGILPRISFSDAGLALPAAEALLAGDVNAMEIDMAQAGPDAIRAVREGRPEMCVGAGGVSSAEDCAAALEAGAQFVTLPRFDVRIAGLCLREGVDVIPTCADDTEIAGAAALGAETVMVGFPDTGTGLRTLRECFEKYENLRFIPLDVSGEAQIGSYIASPAVACVSTGRIAPPETLRAGGWETITENCRTARRAVLGFEFAHVGINRPDEPAARKLAGLFAEIFGFPTEERVSNSIYAGDAIEVMKLMQHGTHGHLAIRSNSVERAAAELERKGLHLRPGTAKYALGRMRVVYLQEEFGGFAVHLIQREV